ncbi:MAG TPA: hypothetical protein VFX03_15750 [Thermomicrobiales bacterium]|nr:hypothetical protein [Thermomicrobiales bacterium]
MANIEGNILETLKHDRLVREGHIAYSSGRHSGALLDPDHLTTNPVAVGHMSYAIAKHFFTDHIQTVASPSIQGAALAMWVAHFLDPTARVVPAEMTADGPAVPSQLDDLIVDRRVLLIDDLIVSGDLIRPLLHSVEARGGEVIGIAALWNVGDPEIEGHQVFGLLNTVYDVWPQADCPLCAGGETPDEAGY